jgi:putative transposase
MTASMSRKGNFWNNAPMESFCGNLKRERVHQVRYAMRAQARSDLFGCTDVLGQIRRQARLNNLSPTEFERRYYQQRGQAA